MRQILWTCVAVWLTGCEIPPDVRAQIACTTICTCFAGASAVEECTSDCVEDGDFQTVPDECFECIQSHANQCSRLENDCEALCARPEPPQEDLPDGGMR